MSKNWTVVSNFLTLSFLYEIIIRMIISCLCVLAQYLIVFGREILKKGKYNESDY